MTASLLGRPHVFERGDRVYLTTPLTLVTPTEKQVEEYAFASAVKSSAPNEHIGWLSGRYVEADRANLNNAMWLNDELALKSLTPMLMPVTVMHDPRTAVGTIADCKLIDGANARIDTILAIWKHRFPDVWEEAEANIKDATMMQSMECYSPWYSCSECGQQYIKLNEGKEQASWCDHLRQNSSRRILGDVCFTGTGLIFGTRGGQGAYTEAYLDHFQDEIAEFHTQAHVDSTYRSSERSAPQMGMVQIDESELARIRQERDDAKKAADEKAEENRTLSTRVEKAEADAKTEKEARETAEADKKKLEDSAQAATLKDKRIGELGKGFLDKLGEFSRGKLSELAGTLSDEDWDSAVKEREEIAGTKRDAAGEGGSTTSKTDANGGEGGSSESTASTFKDEEVASFVEKGPGTPPPATTSGAPAARSLARALKTTRKPAEPVKS